MYVYVLWILEWENFIFFLRNEYIYIWPCVEKSFSVFLYSSSASGREEVFGVSITLRLLRFLYSLGFFGQNIYHPSLFHDPDPPSFSVARSCDCGYTVPGSPLLSRTIPRKSRRKTQTYWNPAHKHARHLYLRSVPLGLSPMSITISVPLMCLPSKVSPSTPLYVMELLKAW